MSDYSDAINFPNACDNCGARTPYTTCNNCVVKRRGPQRHVDAPDPEERTYTKLPKCPNCGDELEEHWMLDIVDSWCDEDGQHECEGCGYTYYVTRHCEVTYSTRTKEEEDAR